MFFNITLFVNSQKINAFLVFFSSCTHAGRCALLDGSEYCATSIHHYTTPRWTLVDCVYGFILIVQIPISTSSSTERLVSWKLVFFQQKPCRGFFRYKNRPLRLFASMSFAFYGGGLVHQWPSEGYLPKSHDDDEQKSYQAIMLYS